MIDYAQLLDNFNELKAQADAVESTNLEDHRRIKLAIVGFSLASNWNQWSREHLDFSEGRLQNDLRSDMFSADWIDFSCLAMGYILGCADGGLIKTDEEFRIADAQLPGFMWLHAEQFDGSHPE